jgi:cytochrome P450
MSALCRRTMNVEALPPATIFSMFGRPLLLINSAEYLQDIYVNKNQFVDKDYGRGYESEPVLGEGIIFASSHDPKTHERRKALSGAFFKSKLLPMTKVIREVTLKVIKNWQKDGDREINLADLTEELQSKIIITVLIGAEY